MKWIIRERSKIDRIACPGLIKNVVDPQTEFLDAYQEKHTWPQKNRTML